MPKRKQLREREHGERHFSHESRGGTNFTRRVFEIVVAIPEGSVLTYKETAIRAGNARAYRAVGNILNKNYDPNIPCHRVIRSDGKTGGYNRGREKKKELLQKEGVVTRG